MLEVMKVWAGVPKMKLAQSGLLNIFTEAAPLVALMVATPLLLFLNFEVNNLVCHKSVTLKAA